MQVKITSNMYYVSPGAGSAALVCKHGIRYPGICEKCGKILEKVIEKLEITNG